MAKENVSELREGESKQKVSPEDVPSLDDKVKELKKKSEKKFYEYFSKAQAGAEDAEGS
jgi:hypothetical protein